MQSDLNTRNHDINNVADTVQEIPSMPQVAPTLLEQFSKQMLRDNRDRQGHERQGRDWLREQAFRFVERVLRADTASGELAIRDREERGQGRGDGESGDSQQRAGNGLAQGARRLILRFCKRMVEARIVTNLANEIGSCIQHAHHFGSAWKLEIVLCGTLLADTRLVMRCDASGLYLHFTCSNERTRLLLEENSPLLSHRLGAISRHGVVVEIQLDPAAAGARAGMYV